MEILLLLGMVALALLTPPVLALLALVRSQRCERRLNRLEVEVADATLALHRLTSARAAREPGTSPEATVRQSAATDAAIDEPPALSAARPEPAPATTAPPVAADPDVATTSRPRPRVEWERWIGIRGAAVLGTLALSLAGLLFFQYTIEHDLISPPLRVVLGIVAGLVCLGGSSVLRRRDYRYTAGGVAGAGVVILYAAFWASHMLYGLVPLVVAFAAMAAVTAVCGWLASRHRSLFIAVTGLVGGFATPLLLSGAADSPLGLFGYVLLLDAGLLWVAHRSRWPVLGLLSLAGTALIQTLWIGHAVQHAGPLAGLLILMIFALLFLVAARRTGDDDPTVTWTGVGAIGLPFLFALYFADRVDLGIPLVPLGGLLMLLGGAAGWTAHRLRFYPVSAAASAASVAVVGTWMARRDWTLSAAWETVAVLAGLAIVYHAFVEWDRKRAGTDGPASAALIAVVGAFLLLLSGAFVEPVFPWPHLVGHGALAALLYRHSAFPERGVLQIAGALLLAIGSASLHLGALEPLGPTAVMAALPVALAALLFAVGTRRVVGLQRQGIHAAAAFAAIAALGWPTGFVRVLTPWPALGVAALLGIVVAASAAWLRRGAWLGVAVAVTGVAQVGYLFQRRGLWSHDTLSGPAFFAMLLTAVVWMAWPWLYRGRFTDQPAAWRAAALSGPLALLPLIALWQANWTDAAIGALPALLGVAALACAFALHRAPIGNPATHRVAVVWFAGVAAAMLAVAVPLQLEREWVTIGWAVQGLALVAVWRRLDHPGLKWSGLALLGTAALRLIANPALLSYHPASAVPIVNWLAYTYLVPAVALIAGATLLRSREVARARPWERIYGGGHPAGATAAGLAAIAVVFVWINLTIADVFATGERLVLNLGNSPAERLIVSIAWAGYGLVLLMLGMARKATGLRWVSLGLLMITIGKVFLYDVGRLQDLYRVASLMGLAISLIAVSLLYQRFVFRRTRSSPA